MWTPTTLGIVPISLICIPRNLGTFGPLIPPPLHCLVGVTGLLRPLLPVGLGASGLDTLDGFGELLRAFPSAGPGGEEGGGRKGESDLRPPPSLPPHPWNHLDLQFEHTWDHGGVSDNAHTH